MSDSSLQIEASELCTAELKSNFKKYILGSNYCLYLTNHSDQIINAWIKVQIFKAKIFNTSLCDEFDCNQLSFLVEDDINYDDNSFLQDSFQQTFSLLFEKWMLQEWGHRLETLYLRDKEGLDRVSFDMLRVKNKYLAAELYYRLMANEQSFQQLSWKYGEGPERDHAGIFKNKYFKDLPNGMPELLRRMKPNETAKPRAFGNYYLVIKLKEFSPAKFDDNMKSYLLQLQLAQLLSEIRRLLTLSNLE